MMRLPKFSYRVPESLDRAVTMLAQAGPDASLVAGGTDLYPNMKRRQQTPKVVVSLSRVPEIRGIDAAADGSVSIGAGEILRSVERDPAVLERLPALAEAVRSISTPILRNMGTIGGNLCLDTRCNYYDQNYEWRRGINFCLKCEGDTCWVAPSSPTCWAVNSSDTVPVMMALGARVSLVGPDGSRDVSADDLYEATDGREWMTRRPGEILTRVSIPQQEGARSVYMKLRRRGAFDFPVLGVAARVTGGAKVERADLVLNAIGPAPVRVTAAEELLAGSTLDDETIAEAAKLAQKAAKPLDNTDYAFPWRRKMVPVFVGRALRSLREGG